ncbi:MAG TPA: beta-ribofuranosylaminobenzene 5'-phosphate synthase [Candidatus Deferrimicrobium sp.]|nr:beta-ribofuranosylaminobenzene 5'-phosphate synthase [Candidatus Deferrimicrobium sp.]
MKIRIITPSRLHFSLIDLNGQIGRIDGGLGVALNQPNIIIEAERDIDNYKLDIINSPGYSTEDLNDLTKNILKSLNIENGISLKINSTIPAHIGLGSKTQLSLAISKALCLLNNMDKTPYELACITSRAGTSRIGLSAFEQGGFIIDGGHSFGKGNQKETFLPSSASKAPPAPILYSDTIPSDWYFVIAIPKIRHGAHGSEEINIFQEYCPISINDVQTISHIILMKILPALKERRIDIFGHGIYELQHIGFKKVEIELQDEIISDLIEFCIKNGAYGSGMSSFGPTTFALIESLPKAQQLKQKIETFLKNKYETDVFITNVNNKGAQIEVI